jgi:hypothetical protein
MHGSLKLEDVYKLTRPDLSSDCLRKVFLSHDNARTQRARLHQRSDVEVIIFHVLVLVSVRVTNGLDASAVGTSSSGKASLDCLTSERCVKFVPEALNLCLDCLDVTTEATTVEAGDARAVRLTLHVTDPRHAAVDGLDGGVDVVDRHGNLGARVTNGC